MSVPHQVIHAATAMLTAFLFLSPCAATAQASAGTGAGSASDERTAIMEVVTTLLDGMRAGDSATVRRVFNARARMISVSFSPLDGAARVSVQNGVDAFVQAVGGPRAEVWDERIANEKVEIDGAVASVWVDYAFFRGTTFSHCGIDHFLLTRRDDGRWTILELTDTRRTTGCEQWRR